MPHGTSPDCPCPHTGSPVGIQARAAHPTGRGQAAETAAAAAGPAPVDSRHWSSLASIPAARGSQQQAARHGYIGEEGTGGSHSSVSLKQYTWHWNGDTVPWRNGGLIACVWEWPVSQWESDHQRRWQQGRCRLALQAGVRAALHQGIPIPSGPDETSPPEAWLEGCQLRRQSLVSQASSGSRKQKCWWRRWPRGADVCIFFG